MDIHIDGIVEGPSSHDEFWDAFIDFVESHGWTFTGTTEVDE